MGFPNKFAFNIANRYNMPHFLKFILTFLPFSMTLFAQKPAVPLTSLEKKQVIDSIAKRLIDIYIYPELAQKMAAALLVRYDNGEYDAISDPAQFASKLAVNLVAASSDRHLNVTFDPTWVEASRKAMSRKR